VPSNPPRRCKSRAAFARLNVSLIGLSVGGKLRMAVTVEAGGAEGWGRPEITAEVNTNHRFVQAPEVMLLDDWWLTSPRRLSCRC
jgi:hypothetical protein